MPNKVELNELTQVVHKEQAFLVALNENFVRLQRAINDTLSRSGVVPNQMQEVIDMNGKRIVNVGAALEDNDALTKAYIDSLIEQVEAAIARLDSLVDAAQQALQVYASEHIYPVMQAALDDTTAARDAAQGFARDANDSYVATKGLYDQLSGLASHLNELLTVYGDIVNIDTVAGLSADLTTIATNIQAILDSPVYAANARIWAEGTDEEVQALGGEHSAKVWASQGGVQYALVITDYTE
jgi:hypothetical protein